MPLGEALNYLGDPNNKATFYADNIRESKEFREEYYKRPGIIKSHEMPWENSPQGLIKHMVHEKMKTTETAMDIYMLCLPPGGKSGKQAQMSEQMVFVMEGSGYDLHWDPIPEIEDKYYWKWEETPKRWDFEEGDVVYIPPYVANQHFNASDEVQCRLVISANRIIKAMGFDWLEQLENAPGYEG